MNTFDAAEADSPTEGRIITAVYKGATTGHYGTAFHFRVEDSNNRYSAALDWDNNEAYLWQVSNGGASRLASTTANYSVGPGSWARYRFTYWEDGGVLNARIEEEQSGSWTGIHTDLSDSNPSFSGGGTLGIGSAHGSLGSINQSFDTCKETWFDETEVYY